MTESHTLTNLRMLNARTQTNKNKRKNNKSIEQEKAHICLIIRAKRIHKTKIKHEIIITN